MKDALVVSLLSVVPRRTASRGMGLVARTGVSRLFTRLFVRAYGVDLSEAEGSLDDYPTLEALFTRRLRSESRPVDAAPDSLVSPVDGVCAFAGRSVGGVIEVAPGRPLSMRALLGTSGDDEWDVVVLYLSPRDYHRVHVPREGVFARWTYVPGTLWPVFPAAVRGVAGLFARNERVVVELETTRGRLQVVLVGAFGVGRIEVVGTDLLTNASHAARGGAPRQQVSRGAELGTFHLGSTVILASAPGSWAVDVSAGARVRVGQRIGREAG